MKAANNQMIPHKKTNSNNPLIMLYSVSTKPRRVAGVTKKSLLSPLVISKELDHLMWEDATRRTKILIIEASFLRLVLSAD